MKKILLLSFLLLSFLHLTYGQAGELDSSFGNNGVVLSDFASRGFRSIAIQKDGKIVAGGVYTLCRYSANGSLDYTFGKDGNLETDFFINAIAIQSDGKIVVAGLKLSVGDFEIVRYNTDGSLDNTFGTAGKQNTDFGSSYDNPNSIALQTDGKIVVAGMVGSSTFDFAIARYNTDGSLDNSFDNDGKLTTNFIFRNEEYVSSVAIQSDGKIVVGGANFTVVRFNSDGSPDFTFNNTGIQSINFSGSDYGNAVAIQDDGKLVIAGYSYIPYSSDTRIVRLNNDGSLDSTFDGDGRQTTSSDSLDFETNSVTIQTDGKIVVAGSELNMLTRYNTDGSLDSSFGINGEQITRLSGLVSGINALAASGSKLYAAGYTYNNSTSVLTGLIAKYTLENSKTTTVKITSPANNTSYTAPAVININATAIAAAGKTITKVQFYNGTALLSSDNASPYSYTWNNVPAGNYAITAKATDNTGFAATSAVINISVITNTPPVVSITSPADNASYKASASINLAAAASDKNPGGSVSRVAFYNGATLLGTDDTSPYTYTWNNVPAGNYKITARATDNSGLVTASAAVNISVVANKPPAVTLTTRDNVVKYEEPARIKLNAAATDDESVSRVEFYSGSALLHTEFKLPYGFLWEDVPAGNYTLTVKAYDDEGLVSTSNSVKVSVVKHNVAPVVSVLNPMHDTTLTGPATIRLIADAHDANDKISKVEFYNGTVLLRTEYYYPYTYNWINIQPGTYTITAKAYDSKGLSTTSAPVKIIVTNAGSRPIVENNKTVFSLKLSPNPAQDILQVATAGLQEAKLATLSIISASGVVMKTIQANNQNQQINVSSLPKGVYTIKVVSVDKTMYKQFVKL